MRRRRSRNRNTVPRDAFSRNTFRHESAANTPETTTTALTPARKRTIDDFRFVRPFFADRSSTYGRGGGLSAKNRPENIEIGKPVIGAPDRDGRNQFGNAPATTEIETTGFERFVRNTGIVYRSAASSWPVRVSNNANALFDHFRPPYGIYLFIHEEQNKKDCAFTRPAKRERLP